MRRPRTSPRRSLLWLIASANAAVLAAALLVLASTPLRVSWPESVRNGVILAALIAATVALQVALARRALAPLGALWHHMQSVDPLHPGKRIDIQSRSIEVTDLAAAFNAMLDRLEEERRQSARRAQAAQDAERRWLSLELHDQIGQDLTAVLLGIGVARRIDDPARRDAALESATSTAQDCLERVRKIVDELRPAALDDLGLISALVHLCDRVAGASGVQVARSFAPDLPHLTADAELGIFRICQESLTNVARHAHATHASVSLVPHDGGVRLTISDDGIGPSQTAGPVGAGSGIRGMRERALLLGAELRVAARRPGGTEIVLDVPATETLATATAIRAAVSS